MSNPFEIVNNILQSKELAENISDYVPYITNRAISYHYDCIMQANEMNLRSGLESNMQYEFLFHSIRKYKRPFRKWQKKEKDEENIAEVKEYYNVSTIRARELISLLSEKNLEFIKQKLQKGGIHK
jgi:hypothetical protein